MKYLLFILLACTGCDVDLTQKPRSRYMTCFTPGGEVVVRGPIVDKEPYHYRGFWRFELGNGQYVSINATCLVESIEIVEEGTHEGP